jgi:hypothetical protein
MLRFSQKYIREGEPLDNTLMLEAELAIAGHGILSEIKKQRGEFHLAVVVVF